MKKALFRCLTLAAGIAIAGTPAASMPVKTMPSNMLPSPFKSVAGKTCKQVNSCEEAVLVWCEGYSRADADNDGIPCEHICHSREQVEHIRRQKC